MLQLKNITKTYISGDEKVEALKGINIQFRESEFVSILGQSGCGKTTLLNIIGGLDRYTSGDLIINGKSTKDFKDRDWDTYRNRKIGFVFQDFELIEDFTAEENICLVSDLAGKKRNQKRLDELLKSLELSDLKDHFPSQMSGGEKQRTAIARALYHSPSLILADEPTGNLDRISSRQVFDLLKESCFLFDQTILVVTHDLTLAKQADTILLLEDGKVRRYESD